MNVCLWVRYFWIMACGFLCEAEYGMFDFYFGYQTLNLLLLVLCSALIFNYDI